MKIMDVMNNNNCKNSNEDDTDSLDIKPPQPHKRHSGDVRRRSDKTSKNKKHSKERKQRQQDDYSVPVVVGRSRERNDVRRGGVSPGTERERDRRRGSNSIDYRREDRRDHDMDHYYQQHRSRGAGGGGPYEDPRDLERRYQKYYDRAGGIVPSNNHHKYHYHEQAATMVHQQPYHHHIHLQQHSSSEFYDQQRDNRHHTHGHHSHLDYNNVNVDETTYRREDPPPPRERRSGKSMHYERHKDAESLEQDLRSRLLIKRHKYVKDTEDDEDEDEGGARDGIEMEDVDDGNYFSNDYKSQLETVYDKAQRSKEERSNRQLVEKHSNKSHHRRPKQASDVIELLDSPKELTAEEHEHRTGISNHRSHKHKRHHHHKQSVDAPQDRIRATPRDEDDRKLRRERDEQRRLRREEARHEKLQQSRAINALSPSAVAASVTAGLHVVKRANDDDGAELRLKRQKRSTENGSRSVKEQIENESSDSDTDEGELDDEDDDDEATKEDHASSSDSESDSVSDTNYNRDYTTAKLKANKGKSKTDPETLPNSPLSFGEISKSPLLNQRHMLDKRVLPEKEDENQSLLDVDSALLRVPTRSGSVQSYRSGSVLSHRRRSPFDDAASSSSSSSTSAASGGDEHSRSHSRSHSGSRSSSISSQGSSARSRSNSPLERNRRRSRSRSQNRLRDNTNTTAKRDENMKAVQQSVDVVVEEEESPVACDDNGVPLPDYFPGVQGCRYVEEFQRLNRIEEGTYGVVYRAKDKRTNEIVALKRLKMEKEKDGFPITSLREINTLLKGQHPNIVTVREIVTSSNNAEIFIVMDYVEHDLKSLMETMKARKQSFLPAEVKCLVQQLLRAVGHLHDNWILHRDLKTSNLLLSHKGILKVGDFGLAREYGSPLKKYTSLVVTLWYRAPELLLCSPEYSTPIDLWSCGCIFAEFLQMGPLFPGKSEVDELNRIFKELGTPNEKIWPGYKELPAVKNMQFTEYPVSNLRKRFGDKTSDAGISLLQGLLTYDPKQRLTAEAALKHPYFSEIPLPIDPSMFPTWPAKSELGVRKPFMASSPKPPSGGSQFKQLSRDDILTGTTAGTGGGGSGASKVISGIITGNKKTASNTGFVLNANAHQRQLAMAPGFSLKF